MRHHDRIQHAREGTDYKAPLRAINETIEGLVHCALIVREHETNLAPETRALDAIGVQVERELKQRAEMIRTLVARCNLLEARIADAKAKGYEIPLELESIPTGDDRLRAAVMPEQHRRTLTVAEPASV